MTRDIDDLILRLSRDVQPVAPGGVQRRLASFAAAGLVMSAALMLLWLGLRPDLGRAVLGTMLWEKGAYTLALAASGVLMTESLARPDGRTPRVAVAIALVAFGSIGFHGLVQMVGAGDAGARHERFPTTDRLIDGRQRARLRLVCVPDLRADARPAFSGDADTGPDPASARGFRSRSWGRRRRRLCLFTPLSGDGRTLCGDLVQPRCRRDGRPGLAHGTDCASVALGKGSIPPRPRIRSSSSEPAWPGRGA